MRFDQLNEVDVYRNNKSGGLYKKVHGGLWSIRTGDYSELSMKDIMGSSFTIQPKVTDRERAIVGSIVRYNYMVRMNDGNLLLTTENPSRLDFGTGDWGLGSCGKFTSFDMYNLLFKFVSKDDSKAVELTSMLR